jgi:WD40 repeat protein
VSYKFSFAPFVLINFLIFYAGKCRYFFRYKYTNESTEVLNTLELHTKACRDIEFSKDGNILYSCSKDKSIMISDCNTGKLKQFYDNAHE